MFKFFEKLTSLFAWLQIALSPIVLGIILGVVLYFALPEGMGLLFGFIVTIAGFVLGVMWAERARKKVGTVEYMARTMATPELDEQIEEQSA
jgi:hypothetical protein